MIETGNRVMETIGQTRLSRRALQKLAIALPTPLMAAALSGHSAGIVLAQSGEVKPAPTLAPTPTCVDDDELEATLAQTEGPFYTPETPERHSLLEPDMPGTRLLLTGYVYDTACQPIPGALLDFWQCDDAGVYDNAGYQLRGHQFADAEGRFELETIMPGLYSGRTRHIHVKAQAPEQPVLTTQLYFPDEPDNDWDRIFNPALLMDLEDDGDGKKGFFTFVLDV
jgi:protocatechuate 3,4-dioxygenase beta subunit